MTRSTGLGSKSKQKQTAGTLNVLDWISFRAAFLPEDIKPIREIKPRRPAPKVTIPSNWKDSEVIESYNKKSDPAHTLPLVTVVDDRTLAAFPSGRPLQEIADVVQCKHCRKPVSRLQAICHIRLCLKKKQEKLQKKKEAKEAKDAAARREKGEEEDSRKGKGGKKSAVKGGGGGAASSSGEGRQSKKRKAGMGTSGDGDLEKPPAKKKKKDEPKLKQPKVKMPVDVERQCGVVLPNGSQCARSLTCKSHSMGAKRAVPGRSLPYDMLLAQYQKKNQVKQQRAAIDANAPGVDEFETDGPVDPEEERSQILAALTRAFPKPAYNPPPVDIRKKYQYVRLKGILGGLRGSGLFSTTGITRRDSNVNGGPGGGPGAGSTNGANGVGGGGIHLMTNGTGTSVANPDTNGITNGNGISTAGGQRVNGSHHAHDGSNNNPDGSSMISLVSEILSAA